MSARLEVGFSDKNTLDAVDSSLAPDNINFPRGMKFFQRKRGKTLEISIDMDQGESQIETLISTLDEIVSHIYTASNTIEKAEII